MPSCSRGRFLREKSAFCALKICAIGAFSDIYANAGLSKSLAFKRGATQ
jgi:hypothetical protein